MAKPVADAELVEGVGVVDRDVGQHEVGGDEQPEHVLANVALADELAGRAAIDGQAVLSAQPLERRPDEHPLDLVEVDALLDAERPYEERAHGIPLRVLRRQEGSEIVNRDLVGDGSSNAFQILHVIDRIELADGGGVEIATTQGT